MVRFAAPWDRSLKVSTAAVLAVLALVGAGLLALPLALGSAEGLGPILALAALAVILPAPACWLLAPSGFAISGGAIRVERRFRPVEIPLASVRAVELLGEDALRGALRTAGASGLFGHFGRFWSRRLGAFRLYATRSRDLVLVDSDLGRFLLSPAPAAGFAETLRGRVPSAGRAALDHAAPLPRSTWLPLVLLAVTVPLLVGGILLVAWAYAPRAATVEGGAVRVERRWAGPVEVPLASISAARALAGGERTGFRRVNGVAGMGGAAYGRFASPRLGSFQLYAFRPGPAVLLETEGGRVVLTPEAPERFLAELCAALGAPLGGQPAACAR